MKYAYSIALMETISAEEILLSNLDEGLIIGNLQIVCDECKANVFFRRTTKVTPHFYHAKFREEHKACTKRVGGYTQEEVAKKNRLQSKFRIGYFQQRFEEYLALGLFQFIEKTKVPYLKYYASESQDVSSNSIGYKVSKADQISFLADFKELVNRIERSRNAAIYLAKSSLNEGIEYFEGKVTGKLKDELELEFMGPKHVNSSYFLGGLDKLTISKRWGITKDLICHCAQKGTERNLNSLLAARIILSSTIEVIAALGTDYLEKKKEGDKISLKEIMDKIYSDNLAEKSSVTTWTTYQTIRLISSLSTDGIKTTKYLQKEIYPPLLKELQKANPNSTIFNDLRQNFPWKAEIFFSLETVTQSLLLSDLSNVYNSIDEHNEFLNQFNTKAGFIYVAWSPTLALTWKEYLSEGEQLVKIGRTRTPEKRESTLPGQLTPNDIEFEDVWIMEDMFQAERYIHKKLSKFRLLDEKELFKLDKKDAVRKIERYLKQFQSSKIKQGMLSTKGFG